MRYPTARQQVTKNKPFSVSTQTDSALLDSSIGKPRRGDNLHRLVLVCRLVLRGHMNDTVCINVERDIDPGNTLWGGGGGYRRG